MNLAHCNLKELTLEEINSVSGGDRGDAAVSMAQDMGGAGLAIGAAIGSVGGIVGAGIGAAIGGTIGLTAGAIVGSAIYDEFSESDPENMMCES